MKKKILVVDDSPFFLQLMDDTLSGLNYDRTTVRCAIEACEKVESIKYDMIVTDLNMPKMDGIEFAKRLKLVPNCKFVPVVMLSGEGCEDKIAEARKVGVSTFLSKPLKENQLKAILQVVFGE